MEETKVLIELLVGGGIQHGWWDSNGIMNKATVEHKILPVLNERLGCQKTHKHYQNQVLEGSGFGWDPIMKRFVASNEVWNDYLKGHPNHKFLRYDSSEQLGTARFTWEGRGDVNKQVMVSESSHILGPPRNRKWSQDGEGKLSFEASQNLLQHTVLFHLQTPSKF
ncbi:hypothetical protein HID58_015404 [Brassica napus]|uniref:Myb/SANT-like domain-containing protein n=1 Tax=Brassica napus TaxID=3708 RepID=A0ABQ8DKS5_BRANA|nr:hypothetical protein HID58_015404 [Brassica napus]